jgi:hypothetical protein
MLSDREHRASLYVGMGMWAFATSPALTKTDLRIRSPYHELRYQKQSLNGRGAGQTWVEAEEFGNSHVETTGEQAEGVRTKVR